MKTAMTRMTIDLDAMCIDERMMTRDDAYWIKRKAKEKLKREKKEALAQLKIELYNLAKPLRFSNCHTASVKLIKNELIVLKQLGQRENEILRWQWAL